MSTLLGRPSDPAARAAARPAPRRRLATVASLTAAAAAVLATAACGAGQHAQTAEERPSLDGTQGTVGNLTLDGVSFLAPSSGGSWAKGSSVPMTLYIANNSDTADKLVKVSSPAFSGWSASQGSSSAATPSSAAGAPATGSSSPVAIPPAGAVSFGLVQGYGAVNGTSSGTKSSDELMLTGLTGSALYVGADAPVTFTFANAGTLTLHVPVQLTPGQPSGSVPGTETSGAVG